MKNNRNLFLIWIGLLLCLGGCVTQPPETTPQAQSLEATPSKATQAALRTGMLDGKMVYIGVGGEIDGQVNPDLTVSEGTALEILLTNGDGMPHDLAIPDLSVQTILLTTQNDRTRLTVIPEKDGIYAYYCTVSGHRQAGMEGKLIVVNP